jgi:hypothetical protein
LALDSAWSKFKNVELISFTNDAQIPEKMNLIGSGNHIHFSSYTGEIVFPNDFIFTSFKELGLSGVNSVPHEISSFINLRILSLFSVKDDMSCKEIKELKSIRELYISEIKNFDGHVLCSLPNLERVEMFAMTFKSDFVDFRCLKGLKNLRVDNTNMKELEADFKKEINIQLIENRLSEEEVRRILSASENSNITIEN